MMEESTQWAGRQEEGEAKRGGGIDSLTNRQARVAVVPEGIPGNEEVFRLTQERTKRAEE